MTTMNDTPFAIHNPAMLPPEVLLGEFTARRTLLETLLRIVRDNTSSKPPQHVVLIGARGMGKTTTLWAVAHSIGRDPDLARQWQPVVFDEESRRVGDLADFWLEAIRQWELATQSAAGQAERLLAQDGVGLEDRARTAFLAAIDHSGKRVVLFVDNLNEVFSSIHDPEALHRLRAFLMEDDRIMILGAATRHFDEITGLDEPFFDFFRLFELSPLTLEEMRESLLALAQRRGDTRVIETIEQRPGTIRSLHVLTGGNPRLMKTFYRLLAEGLRGDVRQDLERLVDEFTPYFKAILDALPMQQQRIVDAVALAWEPVEVATVAQATRLPSNQVSAQLRNLVRSGIAVEAAGSPKRKTYLLADRFSNIHYLMRHGRTARRRFDWFVLTLRALFPDPDQADAIARVAGRTACTGKEGLRDTRDLMASALARAENDDSRRRILHATIKETWDQETLAKFDEWLDVAHAKQHLPAVAGELDIVAFFSHLPQELRKKVGYKPDNARWWYSLTDVLREKEAWPLAETAYRKVIELAPKHAMSWYGLGNLFRDKMRRFTEAETAYRKAVELDPGNGWPWYGLGVLFQDHLGRFAEAEAAYRKANELNPQSSFPWLGLGILFSYNLGRPAEAESAYRKAIELDPQYVFLWDRLGDLLANQLDRLAESETAYRKAIELDPQYAYPYSGLAQVLSKIPGREEQARVAATRALVLEPNYGPSRRVFGELCRDDAPSWRAVLPSLAAWCATHPKDTAVFDFTVDGFISYARLTSPAEAAKLLETLADPLPFEILQDAFRAHKDREHLQRLAPERRTLVLEVLSRMSAKS